MKLSLITASWNSEKTIADTCRSIYGQNDSDFEHLVIDGGSSDRTVEIAEMQSHGKAKIFSAPDQGIYDAMNKGLRLAQGEVIGFINSDDMLANAESLRTVSKAFADESVDACFADLVYVDAQDTSKVVRYWRSRPYRPGAFARAWIPPHPTFYARRSFYVKWGGFDIAFKLAADYELMCRLFIRARINAVYIPQVLVKMRMGGATNSTVRNVVRQNFEIARALRRHLGYYPGAYPFSKVADRLRQYAIARALRSAPDIVR